MLSSKSALACLLASFIAGVDASIQLFSIEDNPTGWAAAIAGKTISSEYNFDGDFLEEDTKVIVCNGPLTGAGTSPACAPIGLLPPGVSSYEKGGGGGIVLTTPSYGFTDSNGVFAGLTDSNGVFTESVSASWKIDDSAGQSCALDFNAVSVSGPVDSLTITVTDVDGTEEVFTATSTSGPSGARLGIISSLAIKSIELYDEGGAFEGTQGNHIWYGCNAPPVANCQDLILSADANCQGLAIAANVDYGSNDPNGDDLSFALEPTAPYLLGDTVVTLTVTDPSGAFATCTATVTVVDKEPPVASCEPGPNPSGNVFAANNQAGFWTISATDNCPAALPLVIEDIGTEMEFVIEDIGTEMEFDGPFYEGTNVQYVQAPGTKKPKQKSGSGSVDWKLTGSGDMQVIVTDIVGNTGDPVLCVATPTGSLRRA